MLAKLMSLWSVVHCVAWRSYAPISFLTGLLRLMPRVSRVWNTALNGFFFDKKVIQVAIESISPAASVATLCLLVSFLDVSPLLLLHDRSSEGVRAHFFVFFKLYLVFLAA